MTSHSHALTSLYTALIDSRNGYEDVLEDAKGRGLAPLFREMILLRTEHADALARQLHAIGQVMDGRGSFMSAVYRAFTSIRSALTGIDESTLPELIDAEERIVGYYQDAIAESQTGSPEEVMLVQQRDVVRHKIAGMKQRQEQAA